MSVSTANPDQPIADADAAPPRRTLAQRIEAYLSRLSTRNNFWHRVCSLIWLPFAFKSGISMKRIGSDRFTAVLPFKRSNRNWYNAMAGAALLGNAEVAAGMFLFKECGSDYIVICKDMQYRFLRPCYGPAMYRVTAAEDVCDDIRASIAAGGEFNIGLRMSVTQKLAKKAGKESRVGRCDITFHCMPKSMLQAKAERKPPR